MDLHGPSFLPAPLLLNLLVLAQSIPNIHLPSLYPFPLSLLDYMQLLIELRSLFLALRCFTRNLDCQELSVLKETSSVL